MQLGINANTLFTKNLESGSVLSESMPSGYHTKWCFHTLPLSVFIDQIENGTVDEDIYNEFFDTIKDKEARYIKKLVESINLLQTKFNLAQVSIKYFEILQLIEGEKPDQDVMKILCSYLAIRPTDGLQIILTRSKRILSDIDLKKTELKKITPPLSGKKADRKYFSHLIIQVTKHLKAPVNKKETTVGEFAEMVIDLRDTREQEQKQANARQS